MDNTDPIKILIDNVASICSVDKQRMLDVGQRRPQFAFPRWLLWLAIKRLTNYNNQIIAEITKDSAGNKHSIPNITSGISKMSRMTDTDYIWSQRWKKVKEVIKSIKKDFDQSRPKQKITIIVPKGIEVEIKEK